MDKVVIYICQQFIIELQIKYHKGYGGKNPFKQRCPCITGNVKESSIPHSYNSRIFGSEHI
jgi:hypothetical protein